MAEYCNCVISDLDKCCNDLNGDSVIDSFERRWRKWNIKDTLKWFEYILTCKTTDNYGQSAIDSPGDSDSDFEELNTSSDSDRDSNCGNDINVNHDQAKRTDSTNDNTRNKCITKETKIDYKVVENNMRKLKFKAKCLPHLTQPFLFRQYGILNKDDRKLLCTCSIDLVNKYQKQRKKR